MKKSYVKNTLYATLLAGAIIIGEATQPFTSIKNYFYFRNASAEDGFVQDPLNWQIHYEKNEKMRIETYLVNDNINFKERIRENGYVGTIGRTIDRYVDKKTFGIKEFFEEQKHRRDSIRADTIGATLQESVKTLFKKE